MIVARGVAWQNGFGPQGTMLLNRRRSAQIPDPGDRALLAWATQEQRVLVTMDADFTKLVFVEEVSHRGIVRLPDVPARKRTELMKQVLERHSRELGAGAIITVRGDRIRISTRGPSR